MRRSLCLFLAICIAYFSLPFFAFAADTEPTEGPVSGLQGATPVAVDADNAVAAALIGLGVQPGSSLDDFNQVVSDCVTALDDQGVFTDGKYALLVNQVDGVSTMYAPASFLGLVRTWLFDDSGFIYNALSSSRSFSFVVNGINYLLSTTVSNDCYCVLTRLQSGRDLNYYIYVFSPVYASFSLYKDGVNSGTVTAKTSYNGYYLGHLSVGSTLVSDASNILSYSGVYFVDSYSLGLDTLGFRDYVISLISNGSYVTDFDLSLGDLSDVGFYSWLENYSDYNGSAFVPMAVQSTYDQTIQTPQEYVQGGITDYTPPVPPDVTVPDWESPDVPQYPGSDSAPPDNELLWGIRVAVSETIPYWIKTTAGTIVEWLQRIYNHITDTVAGLVGVLSTQHDALLAKLDELKAGFGGESSAGDELQSEIDRVDSELDEMTDIMNSVTRPDVDSIDTDISEHIDQANLTLLATPFTAMMTEGPFSTMVFITLTLVLCAYVLYGKR